MLAKSSLFSTLLLAFLVPAHPHLRTISPSPSNSQTTQTAPEVAGAGFNTPTQGSVTLVSAEFTIPHISGGDATSGVVGAMIDGIQEGSTSCFPILCGIQMSMNEGDSQYLPVWQIGNGYFYVLESSVQISAGDTVKVTVEVNDDGESGTVTVVNLKDTQKPLQSTYSVPSRLCMQSGFWVVHTIPGLSLPNFGTMDMQVQAKVSGKFINAQAAESLNLQSGQAVGSISDNGNVVSVTGL